MTTYLVQRLAAVVPVLLLVTAAVFALVHLTPGDAAGVIAGESAHPQTIAGPRRALRLDPPNYVPLGGAPLVDPAGPDAGDRPDGGHGRHGALEQAGGARAGLHPDRPRQGRAGARGRDPPRAAQRADPDRHDRGAAGRPPGRRGG